MIKKGNHRAPDWPEMAFASANAALELNLFTNAKVKRLDMAVASSMPQSSSSTSDVVQTAMEKALNRKNENQLVVGALVTEDILIELKHRIAVLLK